MLMVHITLLITVNRLNFLFFKSPDPGSNPPSITLILRQIWLKRKLWLASSVCGLVRTSFLSVWGWSEQAPQCVRLVRTSFLSVWGWSEHASSVCGVGQNKLPQCVRLVRTSFLSVSGWWEQASSVCGVGQSMLPQCVRLVRKGFLGVWSWSEQASSVRQVGGNRFPQCVGLVRTGFLSLSTFTFISGPSVFLIRFGMLTWIRNGCVPSFFVSMIFRKFQF